jgi:hypothetical protein
MLGNIRNNTVGMKWQILINILVRKSLVLTRPLRVEVFAETSPQETQIFAQEKRH